MPLIWAARAEVDTLCAEADWKNAPAVEAALTALEKMLAEDTPVTADAPRDLLDEVEQALQQATPGPWDTNDEKVFSVTPVNGLPWLVCETPYDIGEEGQNAANAGLIARAPEWLGALVQRVRTAEAEQVRLSVTLTQRVRDAEEAIAQAQANALEAAAHIVESYGSSRAHLGEGGITHAMAGSIARDIRARGSRYAAMVGASRPGEPQP